MTVVTVADAREHLTDLLRRASAGEQIVIADNGVWLAALGAPPPQAPTVEDIAAARERAEAQVRLWHEQAEAEGRLPPGARPAKAG